MAHITSLALATNGIPPSPAIDRLKVMEWWASYGLKLLGDLPEVVALQTLKDLVLKCESFAPTFSVAADAVSDEFNQTMLEVTKRLAEVAPRAQGRLEKEVDGPIKSIKEKHQVARQFLVLLKKATTSGSPLQSPDVVLGLAKDVVAAADMVNKLADQVQSIFVGDRVQDMQYMIRCVSCAGFLARFVLALGLAASDVPVSPAMASLAVDGNKLFNSFSQWFKSALDFLKKLDNPSCDYESEGSYIISVLQDFNTCVVTDWNTSLKNLAEELKKACPPKELVNNPAIFTEAETRAAFAAACTKMHSSGACDRASDMLQAVKVYEDFQ